MSLKGNLRRLRKVAKLTQDQLAVSAGVPQSLISDLETGKRETTSFLPELAQALGCEVKDLDPRYDPLIKSYDPDAPDDSPDPDAEPNGNHFPPDAIKELAAKAGMGSGQTIETSYTRDGEHIVQRDAILDDYWRLPPDFIRGDLKTSVSKLLIVNCRGDSMEPTLRAGDRVVVDTSDVQPTGDRIFAIRDQLGEIVVKRLRLVGRDPIRIQVVSDNPTVDNVEEAYEDVPIVGRVVAGLKLF